MTNNPPLPSDDELLADLEFLFSNEDGCFGDREVIYGEVAQKAHTALQSKDAEILALREVASFFIRYAAQDGHRADAENVDECGVCEAVLRASKALSDTEGEG
jgi:hypothetical protein